MDLKGTLVVTSHPFSNQLVRNMEVIWKNIKLNYYSFALIFHIIARNNDRIEDNGNDYDFNIIKHCWNHFQNDIYFLLLGEMIL